MRVFVIFGGASYAPSHGAESIEVHNSITAAIESFRDRYENGYWKTIDLEFADGHKDSVLMPCVSDDSYMFLYAIPDFDSELTDLANESEEAIGLGYPDFRLTIGPRGGIRREHC